MLIKIPKQKKTNFICENREAFAVCHLRLSVTICLIDDFYKLLTGLTSENIIIYRFLLFLIYTQRAKLVKSV